MTKKFWITTASLVAALVLLCLLRLSPLKLTEQDIIAVLQQKQTAGSILFLQIISDYGKYINIGIPVILLIAGIVKKKPLAKSALIILLGMSLAGVIGQVFKRTVKEPRPYEVDARIQQWGYGGSNSFPSGHTAETVASVLGIALLVYRNPFTIILSVIWALLTMASRITLGVHNFTDICGGIVTACLGLYVVNGLFEKFSKNGNNSLIR